MCLGLVTMSNAIVSHKRSRGRRSPQPRTAGTRPSSSSWLSKPCLFALLWKGSSTRKGGATINSRSWSAWSLTRLHCRPLMEMRLELHDSLGGLEVGNRTTHQLDRLELLILEGGELVRIDEGIHHLREHTQHALRNIPENAMRQDRWLCGETHHFSDARDGLVPGDLRHGEILVAGTGIRLKIGCADHGTFGRLVNRLGVVEGGRRETRGRDRFRCLSTHECALSPTFFSEAHSRLQTLCITKDNDCISHPRSSQSLPRRARLPLECRPQRWTSGWFKHFTLG